MKSVLLEVADVAHRSTSEKDSLVFWLVELGLTGDRQFVHTVDVRQLDDGQWLAAVQRYEATWNEADGGRWAIGGRADDGQWKLTTVREAIQTSTPPPAWVLERLK